VVDHVDHEDEDREPERRHDEDLDELAEHVAVERKGNGKDYPTELIAAEAAKWRANRGWTLKKGTMHVLPNDSLDAAFAFDSLVDRQMRERPRDLLLTP
jgi:lipopolysaccharide export system permease protein